MHLCHEDKAGISEEREIETQPHQMSTDQIDICLLGRHSQIQGSVQKVEISY